MILDEERIRAALDEYSKQIQSFWDSMLVRDRKGLANRLTEASDAFAGWVSSGNQVGKGLGKLVELRMAIQEAMEAMGIDPSALDVIIGVETPVEKPKEDKKVLDLSDVKPPPKRRGRKKKDASDTKGTGTSKPDSPSDD